MESYPEIKRQCDLSQKVEPEKDSPRVYNTSFSDSLDRRLENEQRKALVFLLLSILLLSFSSVFWITFSSVPVAKGSVSDRWFYSEMSHRAVHIINGSPVGSQNNYQIKIIVINSTGTNINNIIYTTNVLQSNFDDIRFTWYNPANMQEEECNYWREDVRSGSNATFWVEIPEIDVEKENIMYIYYGNKHAVTTSNENTTFVDITLALPMDEGSGKVIIDHSGNGNNGSLLPITDGPTWVEGRYGYALDFDGVDDYVNLGHDQNFAGSYEQMTISAWINVKGKEGSWRPIISLPNSEWIYLEVTDNDRVKVAFYGTDPIVAIESDTLFWAGNFNEWFHIVALWNGTNAQLFVNGILESTSSVSTGYVSSSTLDIFLGHSYPTSWFVGSIDDVKIFDRALTEQEIFRLFSSNYGYTSINYSRGELIRKRIYPEPSHSFWGAEETFVPVYDIAVVNLVLSSTEVVKGNPTSILVEVQNEGTENETFNVTAYYNNYYIDTQTISSLEPREKIIISFTWNTTNVVKGIYIISVQTSILPGETDIDDNAFTEGTHKIRIINAPPSWLLPITTWITSTIPFFWICMGFLFTIFALIRLEIITTEIT